MGDAAGQLAHRLHLLGLPQRVLGQPALRHFGFDSLFEGLIQLPQGLLGLSPLQGETQHVRNGLQEVDVVLVEHPWLFGIHLQHAIGSLFSDHDHVDRPAHPMFQQQLRDAEAVFVSKVVGDDRLPGPQGIARGGAAVGRDRGMADHAFVPAHPSADQEAVLVGKIFQYLAVFDVHTERGKAGRLGDDAFKVGGVQRPSSQLGQQRLLIQPGGQGIRAHWAVPLVAFARNSRSGRANSIW